MYGELEPRHPGGEPVEQGELADPQPSDAAAAALLASEVALTACCGCRAAVLRSCALCGREGAGLESLVSDALGLKDLLVEYLTEMHQRTGEPFPAILQPEPESLIAC